MSTDPITVHTTPDLPGAPAAAEPVVVAGSPEQSTEPVPEAPAERVFAGTGLF